MVCILMHATKSSRWLLQLLAFAVIFISAIASPCADAQSGVATPAAASPNPVTATTTVLSVLGTDSGGEASLTYTWSASGPASVTFTANGTNGSKNTTAVFQQAGTYNVSVLIADAAGSTTSSTVAVTVNQTPTTVQVTPGPVTVSVQGTQ